MVKKPKYKTLIGVFGVYEDDDDECATNNGKHYFVKNGGSDAASGLSDADAWATTTKVSGFTFNPGDTIHFKCGNEWRINASDGYLELKSGSILGDVTYTSYGAGAKPLILGSKKENTAGNWIDQGGNIWKCSDAAFVNEVGNIIFNGGTSTGKRELASGNVNAQGDFYYDYASDYVILYSVGNPTAFYSDIECAFKVSPGLLWIAGTSSYITVDGLNLKNGGRHGLITSNGASHITVRNCTIEFMGGCETAPGSGVRLGNGLEFFEGSSHMLVEKNYISQCFDAAFTMQGSGAVIVSDNTIRYNIIESSEYGFEFWFFKGGAPYADVSNIYFQNNTIVNGGGGWGHNQRGGVRGSSINMAGFDATKSNIFLRNNIFYLATEHLVRIDGSLSPNIIIDYNLYYRTAGFYGMLSGVGYATMALWKAAILQESHGVDGDPLFVDYPNNNLRLSLGSPAINAGIDIGYSSDYEGKAVSSPPEIGVYEY